MEHNQNPRESAFSARRCSCGDRSQTSTTGISRRGFLGGAAGTAALGSLMLTASSRSRAAEVQAVSGKPLPPGSALRVKPILTYYLLKRAEKTSWRAYGDLNTTEAVSKEAKRLEKDLKELAAKSDFPIELLELTAVDNVEKATAAADCDCDAIVMFGGGRPGFDVPHAIAAAGKPTIMFLRHQTKPFYCRYETAHWVFMRHQTDERVEPNMDFHDIVVDDYDEIMWRLRALYGLKNAMGTKMLAIGGLQHYSEVGTEHAPPHAKNVWNYSIETIPTEQFADRLATARADNKLMRQMERQTNELLAQPNVTLQTERKFVLNSFLVLKICKDIMAETGATNFGFAKCMGRPVIEMLDTPPCLVLALANDEGYTAYCHADLTHTLPGVLLRWIAGRPTFVCNSHFPHDGVIMVAHCAAPRKMNGTDYEPTKIMTHHESDYGAATKVEYTKGQTVTVIIPALNCSKWQGFRGKIIDAPSRSACRSQMDIEIDGDWRTLINEQVGFHVQICYGDYLREVGYALKKLEKIEWQNFTDQA